MQLQGAGSLVYEIDHPDNSKPGKKLSWESQVTRSEIDRSNPKIASGDMLMALLAGTGALCVILSFSLGPAVSQKSLWITSEVSMPLTLLTQLN